MDLASNIRMAYDGRIATTIRREGEEIDFRIQLKDEQRGDLNILKEILIDNKEQKLIKLQKYTTENNLVNTVIKNFQN